MTHIYRSYTGTVTVLNASYEPMGRVDFKQAMRMIYRKVAVIEEAVAGRSVGARPWPKVIRLVRYVVQRWLDRPARWHRGGVFIRDGHKCAYCGKKATTIDHILPRSRGGEWSWLNCVAACKVCNEAKGNRTPGEARMPLRFASPFVPTVRALVGTYT